MKYEKLDVELMLKNYLKSKSQLEELESKIKKNKILINRSEKELIEHENEIEEMALASHTLDEASSRKNQQNKQTN